MVVSMEQQHGAEPGTSVQTGEMLVNAPQRMVLMSLELQTPIYLQMAMSILEIEDDSAFITSDSPCVWYNPQAHTFPPFYRSPGLAQTDIEVTLPLSPKLMLLLTHNKKLGARVKIGGSAVRRINGRTMVYATNEFVSWKGEVDPRWFERPQMPPDAWENTDDGKKALQQQAEWQEIREDWKRKTGKYP